MPTRLISVPFATGLDEATAKRQLPMGAAREATNVRQRRLGGLGVRADYAAQTMTEFGGTLVPYDLYNMNGRLVALGDRQGAGAPTDVFELVGQPAGEWRGTLPPGSTGTRVSWVSQLRNVGQPPDGAAGATFVRVAALGGLVCMVYGTGFSTGGVTSYAHIFDAASNTTVCLAPLEGTTNARVVVAGDSFWVLGVNGSSDLVGYRFDTSADDDFKSVATLFTGTVTGTIFDACTIADAAPTQFAVFTRNGAGVSRILTFDEDGTVDLSVAGPAVSFAVCAIEADADAGEITTAYWVTASDVVVETRDLSDGSSSVGPTSAFFGEAVGPDLSLVRTELGGDTLELVAEDGTKVLRRATFAADDHARTVVDAHGYILAGRGCASDLGVVQPVIAADDTNHLLGLDGLVAGEFVPLAALDHGIAKDGTVSAVPGMGGEVCRDASTGKFYWGRLVEGTDGQQIPLVAEFTVGQKRRQACQIGNELFISGGLPIMYDGRMAVENGFIERPVFASSTPGTGGSLLPGATYDWCAIYRWVDAQNRLAQSAVSEIQTLTLASDKNSMAHSIYAPHTLRRNLAAGSTPTIELYRTDASVTKTPAVLQGTAELDPPGTSLDGLNMIVQIFDSAGSTGLSVTFDSGDTSASDIVSAINAITTGRVTASADSGTLTLTSDEEGEDVQLFVYGAAAVALGLPFLPTIETGTTAFTRGTVFQLADTLTIDVTDDPGEPSTISDRTSDADLLTGKPLYTQGERGAQTGILEHHSAPACDFCCAVGARVFVGGLADRSAVAISKELFPAEGLAFSRGFAFNSNVDGEVTAVASLDGIPIAFTADAIFRFNAQLPDDSGADGELGPPVRLPSETGCNNPDSIIETALGLFYQSRDGKLMLLPRGGATPIWVGRNVQDTLALFPTVTGAAQVEEDWTVCFTCQNSAGTASVVLVLDMKLPNTWYTDTFGSAQVITAATRYLGRLAYIDGTSVRLQTESLTPAAFIPFNYMTGTMRPFGAGREGRFVSVTVDGEYRGAAQLRARISYNDGKTFTNLTTHTLSGLTAGDSFTRQWWPSVRKGRTFVLDFQVMTNGMATEALVLNNYTVEVDGSSPVQRIRTSSSERG